MNKSRTRIIEETNLGLYLWVMPNGLPVADEDGNYMNIPSVKGDQSKINALRDAARHYGIFEGEAVFQPGRRRITEEEFEEQKARLRAGLVADPYDVAAMKEQARYGRHNA